MLRNLFKKQDPYGFISVLLSKDPEGPEKHHSIRRYCTVLALGLMCLASIVYCYLTYQHTAIISLLGALMMLLLYLALDVSRVRSGISSALLACGIVVIFSAVLLSGTGGTLNLVWSILIPPLSILICGLLPGTLVSLYFLAFFFVVFYTPVRAYVSNIYPEDIQRIYPSVYLFIFATTSVSYYQRFRTSMILYDSKVALEKAHELAVKRSNTLTRETIMSIISAVDARDNYTRDHSVRVAAYSALIAQKMGWSREQIEELYQIALMHDIGKIGIPDAVLKKSASLSADEYKLMKTHTLIGEEILNNLSVLPRAGIGAACHHERYDGKGYPRGLRGDEIPPEARIIAAADAFDAMSSNRVYRSRMDSETILSQMRRAVGTQFDPAVMEVFLPLAKRILKDMENGQGSTLNTFPPQ